MTVDSQKIRELLEKATPGPWAVRYDYVVQAPSFDDGRLVPVAQPYGVNSDGTDLFANARLIAAARNALPTLLAENEALSAELQARQWIRTSDQMPRENDLVLACHIDGDIEIVFGHLLHETKQDGAYSHWQPLPPAPPQGDGA